MISGYTPINYEAIAKSQMSMVVVYNHPHTSLKGESKKLSPLGGEVGEAKIQC